MIMKNKNNVKFIAVSIILALTILAYHENFVKTDSRCKGFASCFEGKIERIIDGDTLVIANKTIRLSLVNAPEKSEIVGKEAENFTANLCPVGSKALVDEDDGQTRGSYGRVLAVVYCKNKNLNEMLLDNGFGEIYSSFCKTSEFKNEVWAKRYGC